MASLRSLGACMLFAASALPATAADKLDKDDKKWLESVSPLLVADEEKTYKALKDKADRLEFQKIFWARRNPEGPAAANNTARTAYETARAQADDRFKVLGRPGSTTDCGAVFILMGAPDGVHKEDGTGGPRQPETWTLKNRPGLTFPKGQIEVRFDAECQLAEAPAFKTQLARIAENRIVSPNIGYKIEKDHLTKLADLLPKPSPAQMLLKEPRQDFPLAAQNLLVMRGQQGATYVAGLIHGDAATLTTRDEGGKKRAALIVAASAADDSGNVVASTPEQETSVEVAPDGSFVASYGLTLKPGKYTIHAAAYDAKAAKGSAATMAVDVPDYSGDALAVSDPIVLADVQQRQAQDPKDPLAAFFLGTAQLVPRFGNAFAPSDAIQVLAFVYNPQPDAAGKTSVSARFAIMKDGKTLSQGEDQLFDTPIATPGIGPVPLSKFAPGKYTIQLKVTDKATKKDVVKEAPLEVTP